MFLGPLATQRRSLPERSCRQKRLLRKSTNLPPKRPSRSHSISIYVACSICRYFVSVCKSNVLRVANGGGNLLRIWIIRSPVRIVLKSSLSPLGFLMISNGLFEQLARSACPTVHSEYMLSYSRIVFFQFCFVALQLRF